MDYVNKHVMEPSGVAPGASCSATDLFQRPAMAYDFNKPNQAGHMSESSEVNCGGHAGLRLSALDLARIAYTLQNGDLLNRWQRFNMDYYKLGWYGRGILEGDAYDTFWHDGDWFPKGGRSYPCLHHETTEQDGSKSGGQF